MTARTTHISVHIYTIHIYTAHIYTVGMGVAAAMDAVETKAVDR